MENMGDLATFKTYVDEGIKLKKEGKFDLAIEKLSKALQLKPENSIVYAKLAGAMRAQKNIQGAIANYQKAIALQPEQPTVVYNLLGDALKQNGQIDEAIAVYQQAKNAITEDKLLQIIKNEFVTNNILITRPGNNECKNLLARNYNLEKIAGFYGDNKIYEKWKDLFIEGLLKSDYVFYVLSQKKMVAPILVKIGVEIHKCHIYPEYLEYYLDILEMISAKNQKILIVHPLEASIENNLKKINKIFPSRNINPSIFSIVKSYNTVAGDTYPHNNWLETFNALCDDIDKTYQQQEQKFRYAMLSCGCYGVPLAYHLHKQYSISVLYVGGLLQLLFGIKGHRWVNRKHINEHFNDEWTFPLENERPSNYENIEKGGYW